MLIVNLAQKQKEIVELLEANGYKFVKKQALKHYFEVPEGADMNEEAQKVKALIKGSEWGQVLFFNVIVA
ncbi:MULTISPECIES: hypothetical protein [unclassified Lactococcus]|uniref:hypothetical protein n=1 Tax=unclassified Lactococcus TaxID=2643510 RepID=UPI0011C8C805|nr:MULTISPECIES: hypothetical protein [unclassified Lactococcus]MQW22780.1 hypothetical protein [Lactococcus sp. dk101]TXK44784.1 hypothetical protein FVP42_04070 [Lactococcus sp. dk310]TXK50678.1 hypothetical protein FVP43_04070 [Lactococcus sp. dk322]